jgi:hypothetical protein
MDAVQFEGVIGGSVDSITFKGSPEEIRQQELLYKSKQTDIYKPIGGLLKAREMMPFTLDSLLMKLEVIIIVALPMVLTIMVNQYR